MFNQPGQGLGFTASKQIAHGLGTFFYEILGIIIIVETELDNLSIGYETHVVSPEYQMNQNSIEYQTVSFFLKREIESRGIDYVRNSI